jgi:hypothetical protein
VRKTVIKKNEIVATEESTNLSSELIEIRELSSYSLGIARCANCTFESVD